MTNDEEIRPYRIKIPDHELADLRDRLARVRWAPEPAGGDKGYGVPVARVRELVEHWQERYDWRTWEARLNTHPQYATTIDGANVHFLHIRSPEPQALPLLLTHGWPGSVAEYLDILGPLTDPRRHGLDLTIAFHLVVPSLPGFGFSGPTPDTGWGPRRIARAWAVLMRRLGHERYGAVGSDWGSFISLDLARIAPDNIVGAHVTQAWSPPPDDDPAWLAQLSARDKAALEAFQHYVDNEASYGAVQGQQPQTLAHALSDSPVGLLGWNAQAMHDLDAEALLTHVTIHWLTGTAGSAIRIYAEHEREVPPAGPTTVPLGVAQFPNDLASIRTFAEHQHSNIISWNHYDRGGHYAAHDAPDLLVGDIRQFFATLGS
jgi:pimeloyl-ACP methyl ester carboxylesterase